jgi:KaiC/GvpD/RAD55 family RecA-like ATPase
MSEELKAREAALKRREEFLKAKEEELTRKTESLIATEITRKELERKREKEAKKAKTGIGRLDDLMFGGIPFGTNVLLYGPPFMGIEVLTKRFVIEGLAKNIPCIIVTVDKTTADIKKELRELYEDYEAAETAGLIGYIDIYSRRMGIACDEPNVEYVDSIRDLDVITLAMNNIFAKLKQKGDYYRLVFPLSTLTANLGAQPIFGFLEDLTGRCKRDGAVAFFCMTKGMHPETDVQVIRHLMDGVIEFKEENLRTFFAVQGICDVQTRSWIQYKFTEMDLIIGSFSLDYIR